MLNRRAQLLSASFILVGCAQSPIETPISVPANAYGVWESNGYGLQLEIGPNSLSAYHISESYCMPSRETAIEVAALMNEFDVDDGGRLSVSSTIDPHKYQFQRMSSLNPNCDRASEVGPEATFEAFVDLMREHYAFFDLHGVDWEERVVSAKRNFEVGMSDQQLFNLMKDMLADLEDAHLSLEATVDGETRVVDSDVGAVYANVSQDAAQSGRSADEVRQEIVTRLWREAIGQGVLQEGGKLVANNRIQYGMAGEHVGYIGFVTMGGFIDNDEIDPAAEIDALEIALDEAISHWAEHEAKSVIVDVSFNHGGYDFIGHVIAARFADAAYDSYTRAPNDASHPYETRYVTEPSSRSQFLGPVYLFTSDMTVSAGEVFVLAMKPLPNVVHVGERTRGAFSTILTKPLPNGWTLNLSNEIYRDHNDVLWEGIGVQPDEVIAVFIDNEPVSGFENAWKELIQIASP